jgi:broad-specificity NMP kinase
MEKEMIKWCEETTEGTVGEHFVVDIVSKDMMHVVERILKVVERCEKQTDKGKEQIDEINPDLIKDL